MFKQYKTLNQVIVVTHPKFTIQPFSINSASAGVSTATSNTFNFMKRNKTDCAVLLIYAFP